jgi:hypothetical protein
VCSQYRRPSADITIAGEPEPRVFAQDDGGPGDLTLDLGLRYDLRGCRG